MHSTLCIAYGMLVALAFSTAHAQEAQIEKVHIYENEKGTVYLNEAFHINEETGPVRITKVDVRHVPSKTAAVADAYYDGLFRYVMFQARPLLWRMHIMTVCFDTYRITIRTDLDAWQRNL